MVILIFENGREEPVDQISLIGWQHWIIKHFCGFIWGIAQAFRLELWVSHSQQPSTLVVQDKSSLGAEDSYNMLMMMSASKIGGNAADQTRR